MTIACGGSNRIWHYGDKEDMSIDNTTNQVRRLYFEIDTITNHFNNTMIGFIGCMSEDFDRFTFP